MLRINAILKPQDDHLFPIAVNDPKFLNVGQRVFLTLLDIIAIRIVRTDNFDYQFGVFGEIFVGLRVLFGSQV